MIYWGLLQEMLWTDFVDKMRLVQVYWLFYPSSLFISTGDLQNHIELRGATFFAKSPSIFPAGRYRATIMKIYYSRPVGLFQYPILWYPSKKPKMPISVTVLMGHFGAYLVIIFSNSDWKQKFSNKFWAHLSEMARIIIKLWIAIVVISNFTLSWFCSYDTFINNSSRHVVGRGQVFTIVKAFGMLEPILF